jgi:glycosyltransferase involved in cell wall biosynthesis
VDILVVDDNSPDGTAEIVRDLIRHREGIYLLSRPGKMGLGGAYKAGFAFALRHGWKFICQMDGCHDPKISCDC